MHTTIVWLLKKARAKSTVSQGARGAEGRDLRPTTARTERCLLRMVRGNLNLPAILRRLMWDKNTGSHESNILSSDTIQNRLRVLFNEYAQTPQTTTCACGTQRAVVNAACALEATTMELSLPTKVGFTCSAMTALFALSDATATRPDYSSPGTLHSRVGGITLKSKTELVLLNRNGVQQLGIGFFAGQQGPRT